MEIRATVTLRNECLIAARSELGLTQAEAACQCGVTVAGYASFEKLDFLYYRNANNAMDAARKISEGMIVPIDDMYPESVRGEYLVNSYTETRSINAPELICNANNPLALLEQDEERDILLRAIEAVRDVIGPRRESVLVLYHGLRGNVPHTLEEIGKKFTVTRERIRQEKETAMSEVNGYIAKKTNQVLAHREKRKPVKSWPKSQPMGNRKKARPIKEELDNLK